MWFLIAGVAAALLCGPVQISRCIKDQSCDGICPGSTIK